VHRDEPTATILDMADGLFDDENWAARLVACELVAMRADVTRRLTGVIVERWAQGLADWGSIDMYGVTLAGRTWREGRLSDRRVMRWARSSDRWRRRLALLTTVPLNSRARGGRGDSDRTLDVCRALVDDRDDMVVKALSWVPREAREETPRPCRAFRW